MQENQNIFAYPQHETADNLHVSIHFFYNCYRHIISSQLQISYTLVVMRKHKHSIQLFPNIPTGTSQHEVLLKLMDWIYLVVAVLGTPVVIVGAIESFLFGKPEHAVQYITFFVPIFIVNLFKRKISYKIKLLILFCCIYILAGYNIYTYGFSGAGIPIFFAFFILSTLFFELKGGLIAVFSSLIPIIIVGILMTSGQLTLSVNLIAISQKPISWVTASTVLIFLGSIMVICINIIKANLKNSVTENRKQAASLEQANSQLKEMIEEKDILLQEIHHRVKNNLNIISSLLSLKSSGLTSASDAVSAFEESKNQIYSIALVHEKLYQYKSFTKIDMKDYIEKLISKLHTSMADYGNVTYSLQLDAICLDINRAIPCGLIINELVTNAFKHAFSDRKKGEIGIGLFHTDQQELMLCVSDNGIGLPENIDIQNPDTLGLQIVHLQTTQLKGNISVQNKNGAVFTITFPFKTK